MSNYKNGNTALVAHYYSPEEIKEQADYVGDSLDLALWAVENKPKRIIHASVRFMCETVKIMLPETEVILPDVGSTCSLVEQTNMAELTSAINHMRYVKDWNIEIVTYINSSAELKAISDWIVTSRNVEEIITSRIEKGVHVYFTPDRNMGAYLAYAHPEWTDNYFDYYKNAVCEVHDKFKESEINKILRTWSDGPKYLLAHPEASLPVLKRADLVGSTSKMLQWVKDYPYYSNTRAQIYVATEEGLLHNMREIRNDIDIYSAPTYTGCACSVCPYMKKNTVDLVQQAIDGTAGVKIDYMSDELMDKARRPIMKMLEFSK